MEIGKFYDVSIKGAKKPVKAQLIAVIPAGKLPSEVIGGTMKDENVKVEFKEPKTAKKSESHIFSTGRGSKKEKIYWI